MVENGPNFFPTVRPLKGINKLLEKNVEATAIELLQPVLILLFLTVLEINNALL